MAKKGKTFFAAYAASGVPATYAVHRAPSGHFSYIKYSYGTQVTGSCRCTQEQAAAILGLTVPKLLEKFKLD